MSKKKRYAESFEGTDDGLGVESQQGEQVVDDSADRGIVRADIPLIFRRRGHGVKHLRDHAITLYMQQATDKALTEMWRSMEDHFDGDEVQKLDVYEAIILNGLLKEDDLDVEGVAAMMQSFGYGLDD